MRYVNEHKTSEYEWFLRLDDDAYVHIEHLESLLRRIDSDQMLYIGSPGFGRDDDDFIEDNMVYCMPMYPFVAHGAAGKAEVSLDLSRHEDVQKHVLADETVQPMYLQSEPKGPSQENSLAGTLK